MLARTFLAAAIALSLPLSAGAATRCEQILKKIGNQLVDVKCDESPDLTTTNPDTTPADNTLAGVPAGAWTPRTDRTVIAPSAAKRPPITVVVPGVQINGYFADDPTGQGRFLLRLPDNWNGRLVVAGASGTRSEFNGDFAWSDYVLQKGYAYASQNKGVLNLQVTAVGTPTPPDPLSCRLNPGPGPFSQFWVRFFDNAADQPFTRWAEFMIKAGGLAREGVKAAYGNWPRYTYAVGTSNGGYQVRRAIEAAPKLFDGGVDWEGTFVDEHAPNLLTDLPPAILNFPDYVAGGFNSNSTAAKNILAAGYGPDIIGGANGSLWGNYWASFWEVTQCQWQKRLDPTYDTYVSGTGTYNYVQRLSFSDVGAQMDAFSTTGLIGAPLLTVHGTLDSLLPIDHHARAYARKVEAALDAAARGADPKRPAYRLYEVQNANHIETYQDTFSQLELLMPHAQKAFDLLVGNVEGGATLPPNQCVPRGGSIAGVPAQPGHCANLFVP